MNDPAQKSIIAQLQALLGVCQSRLALPVPLPKMLNSPCIDADQSWDWQLQESGIFEDDSSSQETTTQQQQQEDSLRLSCSVETVETGVGTVTVETRDQPTQIDSQPLVHQAVQTDAFARGPFEDQAAFGVEIDATDRQDQSVQCAMKAQETGALADGSCQTDDEVMTVKEFLYIEDYYVEQIELLQKEKSGLRKHSQTDRDETGHANRQLEAMGKQLAAYEGREVQFEQVIEEQRQFYEQVLESARAKHSSQLSNLKECLHLVWHEVKDYAYVPAKNTELHDDSVLDFSRHLINSIQSVCAELAQLRAKVAHLADMEKAFQTTLQQADGLVHHIEEQHLQRIRQLELTEQQLRSQLRHHLHQPNATDDAAAAAASAGEGTSSPTQFADYLEAKIKGESNQVAVTYV